MPIRSLFLTLTIVVGAPGPGAWGQAAPTSAQELRQLTEQLQKAPGDPALREKVIGLALKQKPPLPIPEQARRFLTRGIAAFETANSTEEFKLALPEFQKAADLAPWWPDPYFNLAKVQEKVGDYTAAIASYRFYLAAAPGAKDAEAIRTQAYKLEFMAEKKAQEEKAKVYAEQARKEEAYFLASLKAEMAGATFREVICGTGVTGDDGKVYEGWSDALKRRQGWTWPKSTWRDFMNSSRRWSNTPNGNFRFDFSVPGTIRLIEMDFEARNPAAVKLIGHLEGAKWYDQIKWFKPIFGGTDGRMVGEEPVWTEFFMDYDRHRLTALYTNLSPVNMKENPTQAFVVYGYRRNDR